MPIRVRCPKCNETADLPDEARGKRGLCNRCGTSVQIPAEVRKVCVFCHADVTDTNHIKDPDKNYVCETCWKGRNPDPPRLQDTLAPASLTEAGSAPTSTLDPDFAAADETHALATATVPVPSPLPPPRRRLRDIDHHDHDDHHDDAAADAIHDWPYDHRPSFADRRAKPRGSHLATVLSLFSLLVSVGCAYFVWTHTQATSLPTPMSWEEAHRAQMLVLKGQAEILVEMGHLKEGVARYEELERLVQDKEIEDPALRDELLAAWRDRDTAVSKLMLVEQVAQASGESSLEGPAAGTTVTMIEESSETGPAKASKRTQTSPSAPTTQRSTFDPN